MKRRTTIIAFAAAFALMAAPPLTAQKKTKGKPPNYHKADLIRVSGSYLLGSSLAPSWMQDSLRFYYTSTGKDDYGTIWLVDPAKAARTLLFDRDRMAAALSLASETIFDSRNLGRFRLVEDDRAARFSVARKSYDCDLRTYECSMPDTAAINRENFMKNGPSWSTRSPDKEWDVFVWNHNVHLRPAEVSNQEFIQKQDSIAQEREQERQDSIRRERGDSVPPRPKPEKKEPQDTLPLPEGSVPLTTDGILDYGYAGRGSHARARGDTAQVRARRGSFRWSPDSKKLVALKTDIRGVRYYPIYSSTKPQPEDRSYVFATPGDSLIPMYEIHVLDAEARSNTKVNDDPIPTIVHGMTGIGSIRWGKDSGKLFALHSVRGSHRVRLNLIDPNTGELLSEIARDSTATFVELAPGGRGAIWRVFEDGAEIIWRSERTGWSHLYRFDDEGNLKNPITSGPYAVMNVVKVDSLEKRIYLTANGKEPGNPYHTRLYRVGFDGGEMRLLTPEEGYHQIRTIPKGDFFIDTYSRRNMAPRTVVRSLKDGSVVMDLLEGNAELLEGIGWRPAEEFTVKARDGVTDLWGVMYKPSHFDPAKSYPVIDHIYPGPQTGSVGSWSFRGASEAQALAELGFIVIEMDHMGTPGRSKAFHDHYYGDMGDNGLPDHIAGIRQLAARHSWIDINRVGIYGHSGGGFASTDAILRYPDFFHVAVSGAGNHDNRTYGFFWGEKYQGLYKKTGGGDNFESQANYLLAKNLKGKLLLMHGDMDNNVHPANTLRVVHALIQANKDFDMIIYPDAGHGLPLHSTRKRWDYFVMHLLGVEPPKGYQMMSRFRGVF